VGGGYRACRGLLYPLGWNVKGRFDFNFSSHASAAINVGYDSLPVSTPAALSLGIPGGHVDVMRATLDPNFHLTPKSRFDFCLSSGDGYFRVYRQFSAGESGPTSACIPSLGFGAPVNGPVAIPLTYSVNKPGFDVGGGVTIGAVGHMDFLPVTFGFRW
jgi:hypothetical protein